MPKQNFKSHAKRKRELAKLDKRLAKDQKRASRKAEQSDAAGVGEPSVTAAVPSGPRVSPTVSPKPRPLAEVIERWRNTRIVKKKPR